MTLMDPKAAAEEIRAAFERDPPKPEADERHRLTFLEKVCEHLGVEPTIINASHVAHLLTHHDVQMHQPDEYPKMLTEEKVVGRHKMRVAVVDENDDPIVFNSPEEEDAWHKGREADSHGGESQPHDASTSTDVPMLHETGNVLDDGLPKPKDAAVEN